MRRVFYFDMDGVLCDFVQAVADHAGVVAEDLDDNSPTMWGYYRNWRREVGFKESFASLPPLNLAAMRRLMKDLNSAGFEVEILTSLGAGLDGDWYGTHAHAGKTEFLQRHYRDLISFGVLKRFNTVAKSSQKQFYANHGEGVQTYLMDDYDRNITEFIAAGGAGFLYDSRNHAANLAAIRNALKLSR